MAGTRYLNDIEKAMFDKYITSLGEENKRYYNAINSAIRNALSKQEDRPQIQLMGPTDFGEKIGGIDFLVEFTEKYYGDIRIHFSPRDEDYDPQIHLNTKSILSYNLGLNIETEYKKIMKDEVSWKTDMI